MRGAITPIPETTPNEFLAELSERIDDIVRLGSNWDGEDAPAVTEDVAGRMKAMVRQIAQQAHRSNVRWVPPSVAPNPDGGLELSWELGDRWVMLTVLPDQASVGCAVQDSGPPAYDEASPQQAIGTVLRFLADAR